MIRITNKATYSAFIVFLLAFFQPGCADQPAPQKEILYVGTFADEGLYVLEFEGIKNVPIYKKIIITD